MQLFFKLSGLFLFVLAIVFAGNGVFELQNAGIWSQPTSPGWARGALGGALSQPSGHLGPGMLLVGAVLAWLVVPRSAWEWPGRSSGIKLAAKRG